MEAALLRLVWQRAHRRCEYCRMPQELDDAPFEVDHVIARKHDGPTAANNLALSCLPCNAFKGSNIAGRDPRTRRLTPLFNPRRHKWERQLHWRGAELVGRTAVGRVTVAVLNINDPFRLAHRAGLIAAGLLLPAE